MKKHIAVLLLLMIIISTASCDKPNSDTSLTTTENTTEITTDVIAEITTQTEVETTKGEEKVTNLKLNVIQKVAPVSRETGNFPTLAYYGWPSVAIDENDVTYVVVSKRLRHIDPYGKVMMYKSTDKGMTWDSGVCLIDTVLDDRDSGILYLGNGRFIVTTFSHNSSLYLTNSSSSWTKWQSDVGATEKQKIVDLWNTKTEAELTGCSSYIISTDYGKTWSEPKLMPITAPHGPSLLNNGDVMYIGVPKAPVFATGENLESGVYVYLSHNGGETFEKFSQIPVDASYGACEAYGIQLKDGTIVATMRTSSFHTLVSRSEDGGKTWTAVEDITYGAPAHLLQTTNGVIILTYSKRESVTGQYIRLSYDNGKTWGNEVRLSSPAKSTDTDLGYPATAMYSDGTFISVFYQKYGTDSKPSLLRVLWQLVA